MLEYYLSKGFVVLECNSKNLKIIANEEKKLNTMDMHDSDYVMTCTSAITSISSTLKKFLLQNSLHSSYSQTKYIGE